MGAIGTLASLWRTPFDGGHNDEFRSTGRALIVNGSGKRVGARTADGDPGQSTAPAHWLLPQR
jgi:hypothetical protein